MNDKLSEILQYYVDTHRVNEDIEEIYTELIENNVEVKGNSFYCPLWNEELNSWILLAGTMEKADMWVLKKIIRLIKTKEQIFTIFNGNHNYLIKQFSRYNIEVVKISDGIATVVFNKKG